MSNFEPFWICNKGEKTIFEKLTKTFGSPFMYMAKSLLSQNNVHHATHNEL
jgi:hypothetical protein